MKIAAGFVLIVALAGVSLCGAPAYSQDTINGRVLDGTTLEPLRNVNIINASTGEGTLSDPEGNFALPFSPEISVSLLGYKDQFVRVERDHLHLRIMLESSPYDLQEIVVSAFPADPVKWRQSSAAVNLMDKKDLERDNGTIISSALNRTTGIYMHSGSLNTNRITIRGIGSRTPYGTNKVRAYLKDIPLTSGSGETTIEDVDLDFVDRVEVIKGPSSSMYGSGLGGTIILYPVKPMDIRARVVQKNTFGSYGLFRNTTGISHSGEKANINLSYNKTHSDGYRENNTYDRSGFFLLADYFPEGAHSLSLMALFVKVKAYIPSSLDSADFVHNPKAAAPAWKETQGYEDYEKMLAGLSYQYDIRKNLMLKTAVFSGFRKNYELRPFNVLKEDNQNTGIRSFLKYQAVMGKMVATLVAGGEFFYENYAWNTSGNAGPVQGNLLSENIETRQYFNLFAQSAFYPSDKLSIHAGVNLNKTSYHYQDLFLSNGDQTGDHRFDLVFSPRIAAGYNFNAGLYLYGNVSHGFSPPALEETLTPEGVVNPDLQPETGWNFELGIRGKLFENRFYYDAGIYSMQINNLLVSKRIAEDQYIGINAGKTDHNGIEALIRYSVVQHEGLSVQCFTNATLTEYTFQEFVEDEKDYAGNSLPGVPGNTFNAGIDFLSGIGLYGTLNFQFIDEMPLRDDNSIYSEAYKLLSLKAGVARIFFDHLKIDLHAGINNLLNEKYASMFLINAPSFGGSAPRYYYPGLPVNYFGGFSASFTF